MRYIMTGDLHLSAYSNESVVQGLPEKIFYTGNTLNHMIFYALKNDISNMIIGGDIFHSKSILHVVAQSYFLDFIRKNLNITFYIISGNHDMSSRSGNGVSALKCIDKEPNVKMFHEATVEDSIYYVPWNPEKMIDEIRKPPSKVKYLVSHLGLNEAKLNSGISIVSDIGLKDLTKYTHCFLSHYHSPQTINNVSYIGSPIQMDWGEKNEEKRFMVLDTETGEIKSIPTEGYKKHIEIELTAANKDDIVERSRELIKEGHHVKLNKVEDFITDDINDEFRIVSKIERDITNRGITSSMSMEEKLIKYLEIKGIPGNYIETYKNIGISIINECERKG